jgi:putative colanic acid biosynthesis acetyltransferase WcaF
MYGWRRFLLRLFGAKIGKGVIIRQNVTIGKGTVIGARSSVFKDLSSAKVCVGSPAKAIKDRMVNV